MQPESSAAWCHVHGYNECGCVCACEPPHPTEDDPRYGDVPHPTTEESGAAITVEEFADGWALWQEHRPQTAEDWFAVAERCAADPTFDHTKSSPSFGAAVLLARELKRERERVARQVALHKEFRERARAAEQVLALYVPEVDRAV